MAAAFVHPGAGMGASLVRLGDRRCLEDVSHDVQDFVFIEWRSALLRSFLVELRGCWQRLVAAMVDCQGCQQVERGKHFVRQVSHDPGGTLLLRIFLVSREAQGQDRGQAMLRQRFHSLIAATRKEHRSRWRDPELQIIGVRDREHVEALHVASVDLVDVSKHFGLLIQHLSLDA